MSRFYKACLIVLLVMSTCSAVRAQSGTTERGRRSVTCASDDGRRHFCPADTRWGVQLMRQRSGSACIQGSTWGYGRRGIWVDRGCRADFLLMNNNPPGNRPVPSNTLTCSSNDGRRVFCAADTRRGVRLLRQRSGSQCVQGSTWGYDRPRYLGRSRLPCGLHHRRESLTPVYSAFAATSC